MNHDGIMLSLIAKFKNKTENSGILSQSTFTIIYSTSCGLEDTFSALFYRLAYKVVTSTGIINSIAYMKAVFHSIRRRVNTSL